MSKNIINNLIQKNLHGVYLELESGCVIHKGMVDDITTLSLHKYCVLSPCRISVRLHLLFRKFNGILLLE